VVVVVVAAAVVEDIVGANLYKPTLHQIFSAPPHNISNSNLNAYQNVSLEKMTDSLIIRFQKTDCCKENDDTLYAINNYDGTIDVVMKSFTSSVNSEYTLQIHEFYRYIDMLYSIFQMDTNTDDGTSMSCIQVDITGFPTFILGKHNFEENVHNLNALIEYWTESA
jgi:hypothetical protein